MLDRELPAPERAGLLLPLGDRSRLLDLLSESFVGNGFNVVVVTVPDDTAAGEEVEVLPGALGGAEGEATSGAAREVGMAPGPTPSDEESITLAFPKVAVESVDISFKLLRLITCVRVGIPPNPGFQHKETRSSSIRPNTGRPTAQHFWATGRPRLDPKRD